MASHATTRCARALALAVWVLVGPGLGLPDAQTMPPSAPRNLRIFAGSPTAPAVTITVSPPGESLQPGETVTYAAAVTGTTNTSVIWSATGGTITTGGTYTAGTAPGAYAVTAALSGGTLSGTATVTIEAAADALTDSGPITTTRNGQVITGLRITSTSGNAITVRHTDVLIRNVDIRHAGGHGIDAANATRLRVEDVNILHTGAPAAGANADEFNSVNVEFSPDIVVTRVRTTRGSSGFYILESPRARLTWIECHDSRGPFPRGQCVQFNRSHDGLLEDFSYERATGSWEEDNISAYRSSNVTIRRGLIDGNNSPSGVGVMFEQDDGTTTGGLAEDVDAIHMGNGAFSGYPAKNVTFRRTRARDNICISQGRGAPLSNALVWAGRPAGSSGLRIEQSEYYALCNPGNIIWEDDVFTLVQFSSVNFTPREPVRLVFPWE